MQERIDCCTTTIVGAKKANDLADKFNSLTSIGSIFNAECDDFFNDTWIVYGYVTHDDWENYSLYKHFEEIL